jgi:hypothetical protein
MLFRWKCGLALALVRAAALGVLALGPVASPAIAQTVRENLWITDGTVYATALYNNVLYVGGSFTRVGPVVGRAAALDAATGQVLGPYPRANLPVYAATPDGNGGWYIGGAFTSVCGQPRDHVAQFDASGNLTSWNPGANGRVVVIHVSGGTVYLGGDFTVAGGQPRNGLAAVDVTTGMATGWNPNPSPFPSINALTVQLGVVYVGGTFTSMGGQARTNLAALDAATGSATSWNPNPNGTVNALFAYGELVYAGGAFTNIGGQARSGLAQLDMAAGAATSWDVPVAGSVSSMELHLGTLYVAGLFGSVGGLTRNYVAAVDAPSGFVTGWDPNPNGPVYDVARYGGGVYLCGNFTTIGGQARRRLAMVDAATGAATEWNVLFDSSSFVNTVVAQNATVYVGGDFISMGQQLRNNLAAFDRVGGVATLWNPDANGTVRALSLVGSTIYAGGDFTTISGLTRNRMAGLDPLSGAPNGFNLGVNGTVYTLASFGNTMYVGGSYTFVGGLSRNNLASIDLTTPATTGWDPNVNNTVRTIGVAGLNQFPFTITVYLGGDFTTIGGLGRNRIGSVDGSSTAVFAWNPNANLPVHSLAVFVTGLQGTNRTIYAGGSFTTIGGASRNRLAALDGNGVATAWNPDYNGTVYSFGFGPNVVYFGGSGTTVGGQFRRGIACLDRATGVPTSWSADAGNGSVVYTVLPNGSTIYAGGSLYAAGDHANLAAFSDGVVTAVETPETAPRPALLSAAPNPFRSEVAVRFSLPRSEDADVAVFDASGRLVRRLYHGALPAGAQRLGWDGRNEAGRSVGSGLYFLQVETPTLHLSSKVFRLR